MAIAASYVAMLDADLTGLEVGIASARAKLAALGEGIAPKGIDSFVERASKSLEGLSSSLVSVGGSLTAAMAPLSLMAGLAAKTGISFDSLKQQALIAFTTMLGGGEQAKQMLEDLTGFAAKTPFTLRGLIPLTQQLIAFGFQGREIIPMLTSMGDAIAGLGRGEPEMQRLILNLGQIKAQGHLTGRELRDIGTLGIPALQILADTAGKTTAQMQDMISKGIVSADFAIRALTEGLEKGTKNTVAFGGMMEKQSHTIVGILSNLKDTADKTLGTIFQPLVDKATPVLERFQQALAEFGKQVQELGLVGAISDLTGLTEGFIKGAAAIGAVLLVAGPLTLALGVLGSAIAALLSPIGLVVTGLAALSAAYFSNWAGVQDRVNEIVASLNHIWEGHGSKLTTVLSFAFKEVVAILETAAGLLLGIVAATVHLLEGEWGKAGEDLIDIWTNTVQAQEKVFADGGLAAGKAYALNVRDGVNQNIGPWAEGIMPELEHMQKMFAAQGAAAGAAYAQAVRSSISGASDAFAQDLKRLQQTSAAGEAAFGGIPKGLQPGSVKIDESVLQNWRKTAEAASQYSMKIGEATSATDRHTSSIGKLGKAHSLAKAALDEFQDGLQGFTQAVTGLQGKDFSGLFERMGKKGKVVAEETVKQLKAVTTGVNEFLNFADIKTRVSTAQVAKHFEEMGGTIAKTAAFKTLQSDIDALSFERVNQGLEQFDTSLSLHGKTIDINTSLLAALKAKFPELGAAMEAAGLQFRAIDRAVVATKDGFQGLFDGIHTGAAEFDTSAQIVENAARIWINSLDDVRLALPPLQQAFVDLKRSIEIGFSDVRFDNDVAQAVESAIRELEIQGARMGLTGQKLADHVMQGVSKLQSQFPALLKGTGDAAVAQWAASINRLPGTLDHDLDLMLKSLGKWKADSIIHIKGAVSGILEVFDAIPGKLGQVANSFISWVNRIDQILGGLHKIFPKVAASLGELITQIVGIFQKSNQVIQDSVNQTQDQIQKTAKSASEGLDTISDGLKKSGDEASNTAGKWIASIAAVTSAIATFVGTRGQGKLAGVLGGAAAGAQIGALFGGVGAAVGAGIGAIVGLFGSGKSQAQKDAERKAAEQAALAMQQTAQSIVNSALDGFMKGLDFLEKLAEFTPVVREKFDAFFAQFKNVVNEFFQIAKEWSAEAVAQAKALAETITPIADALSSLPLAFQAISLHIPVAKASFDTFFRDMNRLLTRFFASALEWAEEQTKPAAKIAERLRVVAEMLAALPTVFAGVAAHQSISKATFDSFFQSMNRLMKRFFDSALQWVDGASKEAQKVAERLQPVVGIFLPIIETLTAMKGLQEPTKKAFAIVEHSLQMIVGRLLNIAEEFDLQMINAVTVFSQTVEPAMNLWKSAVEAIKETFNIRELTSADATTIVSSISTFLSTLISGLEGFSLEQLDRASKLSEALLPVTDMLKNAIESIKDAASIQTLTRENASRVVEGIRFFVDALLEGFQSLAIESLENAAKLSESLEPISSGLKSAIDLVKSAVEIPLPNAENARRVVEGITQFVNAFLDGMGSMGDKLKSAAELSVDLVTVAGGLKAWVEAAGLVKGYAGIAADYWLVVVYDFERGLSFLDRLITDAGLYVSKATTLNSLVNQGANLISSALKTYAKSLTSLGNAPTAGGLAIASTNRSGLSAPVGSQTVATRQTVMNVTVHIDPSKFANLQEALAWIKAKKADDASERITYRSYGLNPAFS